MALIDLAAARAHLRVEDDYPDAQIQPYIDASVDAAQRFLNRNIYENAGALAAAVANMPTKLQEAADARQAAIDAAKEIEDGTIRCAMLDQAEFAYKEARQAIRMAGMGCVINPSLSAAILLICGHLFENRQDVVTGVSVAEVPLASQYLMIRYRVGWGI